MPGWFFLYPLLGEWAARRASAARAATANLAALVVLAGFVVSQGRCGWIERLRGRALAGPDARGARLGRPSRSAGALAPPGFCGYDQVVGGRQGRGRARARVPIFVFSDDPRGIAFLDRGEDFVGRDAVIIVRATPVAVTAGIAFLFRFDLGARRAFPSCAKGRSDEEELAIVPAYGLTRPFPVPYPLGPR